MEMRGGAIRARRRIPKRSMDNNIDPKEEQLAKDTLAHYLDPEVPAVNESNPDVVEADGEFGVEAARGEPNSPLPETQKVLPDLHIAEGSTVDEVHRAIDRHAEVICETLDDEEAAELGAKVLEELGHGAERDKQLEAKKAEEEAKRQSEHVKKVTSYDLPVDYVNPFENEVPVETVDNVEDALMRSLATLGKVDMEYIAAVSGRVV